MQPLDEAVEGDVVRGEGLAVAVGALDDDGVAAFVEAAAGVPIDAVTLQNEPQNRHPSAYPGTDLPAVQEEKLAAAVGAAFLALVWPRLHGTVHRLTAAGAVAVALGLVPYSPAGAPVLAAAGVAVIVALLARDLSVEPTGDEPTGELP